MYKRVLTKGRLAWNFKKCEKEYPAIYTGNQRVTFKGLFKPIPEMEGMEGRPVKIFGLVNWYDIGTPAETVPTHAKSRSTPPYSGCVWHTSKSEAVLSKSDLRFKLKDINTFSGKAGKGNIDVPVDARYFIIPKNIRFS